MLYRDIVECIKVNQIRQGVSVEFLAKRLNVTPQTITNIRGYRLKVSRELFDSIIKELGIFDLDEVEKERLLNNQQKASDYKRKKYLKLKNRRN